MFPLQVPRLSVIVAGVRGALCFMTTAQPVVAGDALTAQEGLTLYTFDNDVPGSGKSVCYAPWSGTFPPKTAMSPAGAAIKNVFAMPPSPLPLPLATERKRDKAQQDRDPTHPLAAAV
jgi:hypothetical protein